MAKEIVGQIKLQIPAGQAIILHRRWVPALGQQGVNIMAFCKEFNAATQKPRRETSPSRRDHGLQGQELHLHHQETAGFGVDQEAREHCFRFQGAAQAEGWQAQQEAGPGHREDQQMKDLNARTEEAAYTDHRRTARQDGRGSGTPVSESQSFAGGAVSQSPTEPKLPVPKTESCGADCLGKLPFSVKIWFRRSVSVVAHAEALC